MKSQAPSALGHSSLRSCLGGGGRCWHSTKANLATSGICRRADRATMGALPELVAIRTFCSGLPPGDAAIRSTSRSTRLATPSRRASLRTRSAMAQPSVAVSLCRTAMPARPAPQGRCCPAAVSTRHTWQAGLWIHHGHASGMKSPPLVGSTAASRCSFTCGRSDALPSRATRPSRSRQVAAAVLESLFPKYWELLIARGQPRPHRSGWRQKFPGSPEVHTTKGLSGSSMPSKETSSRDFQALRSCGYRSAFWT
mmetsp:Transcript_89971/g.268414  ORF Transcript_89971/g.268414 Transcript_89971/m.268414 type:complete len:254 (-) Transcript_89971:974-1735(-)